MIRLLEERFQGLYAPSAGTVYPRLAKLEAEGLVTHTTEGGRKVYAITDAGRAELADRSGELADLELEIRESVAELAAEDAGQRARGGGRPAAGDAGGGLRGPQGFGCPEHRRETDGEQDGSFGDFRDDSDKEAWRTARRCAASSRNGRNRPGAPRTRAGAPARRPSVPVARPRRRRSTPGHGPGRCAARMARRVQEQVQDHFARGDWPTGVREGLTELAKEFGEFGKDYGKEFGKDFGFGRGHGNAEKAAPAPEYTHTPEDFPAGYEPSWAHEDPTGDPPRDLERLLDRFRDDIRDAARDHGVTPDQLRDTRRHLSTAAAHIGALLRTPKP
ncbi:PadR family transcriptional regulator OS=Streptomyces alboniger OX=132473 GN=CP975_24150 PE=4 SV=1 [Streptomyces alboniger]